MVRSRAATVRPLLALALALGACAGTPAAQPPPGGGSLQPASQPAQPEGPAAARAPFAPCRLAASWRDQAAQLSADGWLDRPSRLLDRADARCPSQAAKSDELRRTLASELARGGGAEALLAEAARHAAAGQPREARRSRALAALALEQQLGSKAYADVSLGLAVPLAFAPDGRTLAARRDGGVVLLDTATLTPRGYVDSASEVSGARYSEDGTRLALLTRGALAISLYDVASLQLLRTFSWGRESPIDVAFLPRSQQLVLASAASFEMTVRKFDIASGESVAERTGDRLTGRPTSLAVSADGRAVAVGTDRGVIELLDGGDLSLLRRLSEPRGSDAVSRVAFSKAGGAVAARLQSGALEIWDRATGKARLKHQLARGWSDGVLAFTAGDERLLVLGGSFDRELLSLDVKSGAARSSRPVTGEHLVLTNDGQRGATVERDDGLVVVDFQRDATVADARRVRARIADVALGDARLVVAHERSRSSAGSALRLWDWDSASGLRREFTVPGYRARLALSPDGEWLAGAFGHGSVRAWRRGQGASKEWPRSDNTADRVAIDDSGRVFVAGGPFELGILTASPDPGDWTRVFHHAGRPGLIQLTSTRAVFATKEGLLSVALDGTRSRTLPALSDPRALALASESAVAFVISKEGLSRLDLARGSVERLSPRCEGRHLAASADGAVLVAQCSYDRWLLLAAGVEHPLDRRGEGAVLSPGGQSLLWLSRDQLELVGLPSLDHRFTLELWERPEALLARSPSGRIEVASELVDLDAVQARLGCRIGSRGHAFEVCADRLLDDGLVLDALTAR